MFKTIKGWYDSAWAWVKNSGTILLARIELITGIVIAGVSAMDWSPLWSFIGTGTDFNWKQGVTIGVITALKGIVAEVIRRRGTKEVNDHLVPTAEALKS